ncbi:MAG: ribonuclease D, partial [Desulfobacteraceae bacterium]
PGSVKVLHGADYDIRSLDREFNLRINNLFDTQIAARYAGLCETGLASLLSEKFGIITEKKHQKSDWSIRPLPEDMLAYAARDAAHLIPLYRLLKAELEEKGRLRWVEEESEILSRVRHAPAVQGGLFRRVRGAGDLDPRGLAVLEELLQFRNLVAEKRDVPPFHVLGNAQLLEIARTRPTDMGGLEAGSGLRKKQLKALGQGLLERIQKALQLPADALPVYPKRRAKRQSRSVVKRMRALKEWRRERAFEMDLDPPLLLTNSQIIALSMARPEAPSDIEGVDGIRRWQQEEFGVEICEVIRQAV